MTSSHSALLAHAEPPSCCAFESQEADLSAMRTALSFVRVQAEEWRVKMECAHREAQVIQWEGGDGSGEQGWEER
jgi:hypothetical protein